MSEEEDRKLALRLSGQSEYTFSHDPASILPKSDPISLKSCPFCGWDAILFKVEPIWWYIQCTNEDCRIYQVAHTTDKVIERWNRRTGE